MTRRHTHGHVIADDSHFAGVELHVAAVDTEEPTRVYVDRDGREFCRSDPVRVNVTWELNASDEPGLWLSREGARELARVLTAAANTPPSNTGRVVAGEHA